MKKLIVPTILIVISCAGLLLLSGNFLAPKFEVSAGKRTAELVNSRAAMGLSGKPIQEWQVRLETGALFWVRVPPSYSAARGQAIDVELKCVDASGSNCIATLVR